MHDSPRYRLSLLVAVLLAATPVIFGFVRAINTGDDFRYLWLAAAAIVGSSVVMVTGTAPQFPRGSLSGVRRAPSPPEARVLPRRPSYRERLPVREWR